jgi:hypothetical protein
MTTEKRSTSQETNFAPPSISELRDLFHNRVIAPDDAGYDGADCPTAGSIAGRPIVRVADAEEVSRLVSLARETGLELAVRSGGHSVAGHSVTDGGIVLDLSGMRDLQIDIEGPTAWAETGLTAGEYTNAVGEYGLATASAMPARLGSAASAGRRCRHLVRKYGLTIDTCCCRGGDRGQPVTPREQLSHTRTCSGRSAAAAAASASRPASSSASTRSIRSWGDG